MDRRTAAHPDRPDFIAGGAERLPEERRRSSPLGVVFAAVLVVVLVIVAAPAADGPGDGAESAMPTTPAPQAPTTTAGPRRAHSGALLVVGDSLTVGADSKGLTKLLKAAGWQPTIEAEEGRSTKGAIDVVQRRVKVAPPLVLVELGTNPGSAIATFAPEVDNLVDLLRSRGAQRVVWVTPVHHDDDRYDDKVRVLEARAVADPEFRVADWRRVAWANKEWFRADGLHYNDAGFAALAQFLDEAADANDPAP
ncbi:MAG: hypothetical protein ABIV94_11690 [Acidimicrobiales bacterium]